MGILPHARVHHDSAAISLHGARYQVCVYTGPVPRLPIGRFAANKSAAALIWSSWADHFLRTSQARRGTQDGRK